MFRLSILPVAFLATVLSFGAASAGVQFTTLDAVLVGSPLGIATSQSGDPIHPGFDVVRRDESNAPVPGATVKLHFAGTNLALYASQNSGTTIDCIAHTLGRVTDAQGHVNFAAQFGGWNNAMSVEVTSDDESFGFVKARSPDYDGDGRVVLLDLSEFAGDFLTNTSAVRSDFDVSNLVGLGDLSIFAVHFLGQGPSPKPLCPQ
jgi:hypothetical protein